jgi:hypothetical protein
MLTGHTRKEVSVLILNLCVRREWVVRATHPAALSLGNIPDTLVDGDFVSPWAD